VISTNTLTVIDNKERVLSAALSGLSPNTCRVYTRHLVNFLAAVPILDREHVARYMSTIPDTSNYNQALSAIKRLAAQSAANGWIPYPAAIGIDGLPAKRLRGTRSGTWLSLDQAKALLTSPDASTLAGKRDRAVLALLVGCGLRRDELSRLTCAQLVSQSGRTKIANLLGKGNRVRSILVPEWANFLVSSWKAAAHIDSGYLIRSFKTDGTLNGSLSVSGIWNVVLEHSTAIGVRIAPHDLRRTYAKLARTSGAPIEVIQHSLGHSSVTTTERYMATGEESNAGDYFSLA
jgi:integrase